MTQKIVNCFLFLLVLVSEVQGYYGNDAILLDQVKTLTFATGKMTTGRRNSPIPQLQCVSGSACYSDSLPLSVQCTNVGTDSYGEVQWQCKADLDSSVRFGQTTVSCEGYSNPNDPYILKGSCGLEYFLEYTEQGKKNQNHGSNYFGYSNGNHYPDSSQRSFNWGNVFMFVIFGAILLGLLQQYTQNTQSAGTPNVGGSYYPSSGSYPPGPTINTNRPGFWSGFGAGGLLGYFFRPRGYGYGYGGYNGGYGGYNQGFGGYNGGYGGYNGGYNQPSYRSSGGSFGSTSSPRTASAFASTKRR